MADLLQKQAIAVVDDRTTAICLDVAGQVRNVDEPFDTLAGQFEFPPFHRNCRTHSAPYMAGFPDLTAAAAAVEMASRPAGQRGQDSADAPAPPADGGQLAAAGVAARRAAAVAASSSRRRRARYRRRRSAARRKTS